MPDLSVFDIQEKLKSATLEEFEVLERSLVADTRKGVVSALKRARHRLDAEEAERKRLEDMYSFESTLRAQRGAKVAVGLDEVGRGPLAGPLAVGAVILPLDEPISFLNDSKQVSEKKRVELSERIKDEAKAYCVEFIEPKCIDDFGIMNSLKTAFSRAVKNIEDQGFDVDLILLDGNPLHFDKREFNVVKGDSRCPSIAAASIIAKVERDGLMERLSEDYPEYGFDVNKGYGTETHRQAIEKHGLCPVHRRSFCSEFTQQTLF